MHFQIYSAAEDNTLNCGARAFCSSWGSGDAALHRDTTPGLSLHVALFPRAGRCQGAMATKATSCLPSSRDASGVAAAAPGAPCIALTDTRTSRPCPFNRECWGNLKQRKGRAENWSVVVWSWAIYFPNSFFLLAAFLCKYMGVWLEREFMCRNRYSTNLHWLS